MIRVFLLTDELHHSQPAVHLIAQSGDLSLFFYCQDLNKAMGVKIDPIILKNEISNFVSTHMVKIDAKSPLLHEIKYAIHETTNSIPYQPQ